MSDIFDAIDRADFGKVWQLVQSKAVRESIDPETGMTPLALAAEQGRTEIVRTLLEAEVDPNFGGEVTPLEVAVGEGDLEIVRLLLDAGADPNREVAEGFTPMMTAALAGDAEICRLLMEAGGDPRRVNDDGDTAIDLAENHGFDDLAAELDLFSPEELAAKRAAEEARRREEEEARREKRRRELEEKRKNAPPRPVKKKPEPEPEEEPLPKIDLRTPPSVSPMAPPPKAKVAPAAPIPPPTSAAEATAAFDALFANLEDETGAEDLDPDSLEGLERFRALLEKERVDEALEMVRSDLITPEERGSNGLTPLMIAAEHGALAVVEALIEAGAEVDARDRSEAEETALLKAIHRPSPQRLDVISRLAAAGAELDRRHGDTGMTPLMYAATADVYTPDPYAKHFGETARRLIALGARLDATDHKGNTVWRLIKRNALGALTSSPYRRRLFQMLRVLESEGAEQIASHEV